MKHLIAFSVLILLITYTSSQPQMTSNCGTYKEGTTEYIVPTNSTMCNKVPLSGYMSCCYVDFKIASKNNICVETNNSENWKTLQEAYQADNRYVDTVVTCPTKSAVPNSCGLVGMMEPTELTDCSVIAIPESFCCLVKVTTTGGKETSACRRLDEFPNEDSDNTTIKAELANYGTVKGISCHSFNLMGMSSLMLIVSLFVLITL